MRKSLALIILIAVFIPLAFAALTLTSIRPWVLDRSFYERIVSNEAVYKALLNGDLDTRVDGVIFVDADQLPIQALNIGLREVVTADYLRTQSVSVVNQMFDVIDGRSQSNDISFDVAPIKAALAGEGGARFASALAMALPACQTGQDPLPAGGRLVRCIAADSSVDAAAEQIVAALPAILANTPDTLSINDRMGFQGNWRNAAWLSGTSARTALDVAIIVVIVITAASGIVGSFIGGDDLRGRLRWLGSSLFVPASLFLLMGLTLATPFIDGPLRLGLANTRWDGIESNPAFQQAVTEMVGPLVRQIGQGFLLTGIVSSLIALALLALSWIVIIRENQTHKMVQVPVRNS